MMNIDCGIIKDLMPLYEDEICTEESRKAVEEHLRECAACRELYQQTSEVIPEEIVVPEEAEAGKRFKKGLQKLRRRWAYSLAAMLLAIPLIYLCVAQIMGDGICFTNIDDLTESYYYLTLLKNGEYGKAFDRIDWRETWDSLTGDYHRADWQMVKDAYQAVEIDGERWMFLKSRVSEFFGNELPDSLEGKEALNFWEMVYQHTQSGEMYLIPAHAYEALNLQQLYEEAAKEKQSEMPEGLAIQKPVYAEDIDGKGYYMGCSINDYDSTLKPDIDWYFASFACIPETVWETAVRKQERFRAEFEKEAQAYLAMGYDAWLAECRRRFVAGMEEWETVYGRIEKIRFHAAYKISDSRSWQIEFDLYFNGEQRSAGGILLFVEHGTLTNAGSAYGYGGIIESFTQSTVHKFTEQLSSYRNTMIFHNWDNLPKF